MPSGDGLSAWLVFGLLALSLVTHVFGLSVSSCVSFSSLCLSRNLSITCKLPNLLVQLLVVFLCISFYFFRIGSNVSSFISDSGNLLHPVLLSWSVKLKICQFCCSFLIINFWFHWFSLLFSCYISLIYVLILLLWVFIYLYHIYVYLNNYIISVIYLFGHILNNVCCHFFLA